MCWPYFNEIFLWVYNWYAKKNLKKATPSNLFTIFSFLFLFLFYFFFICCLLILFYLNFLLLSFCLFFFLLFSTSVALLFWFSFTCYYFTLHFSYLICTHIQTYVYMSYVSLFGMNSHLCVYNFDFWYPFYIVLFVCKICYFTFTFVLLKNIVQK